jgi:hypothetical protein
MSGLHLRLLAGLLSSCAMVFSSACLINTDISGKSCNSAKHPCVEGYQCVEGLCLTDEEADKVTSGDGGSLADSGQPDAGVVTGDDGGVLPPDDDSGTPPPDPDSGIGPPLLDGGNPPPGPDGGGPGPGDDGGTGPGDDGGTGPGDDGGVLPGLDGGLPLPDAGPAPIDLSLDGLPQHALAIQLTFSAGGSGADSLRLLRRLTSEVNFGALAVRAANVTAYTDGNGLMPETSYVYRLEAVGADGGFLGSQEKTLTTPAISPITDGLVLAYGLDDGAGGLVADTSSVGTPFDLALENAGNTSWLAEGGLSFNTDRCAASVDADVTKLYQGLTTSGEMTVETWTNPTDLVQGGPARMVSYSISGLERNFTLGQDGANLVFRIRTPDNGLNGIPEYKSFGALTGGWQHVAATFDGSTVRSFVDGAERPETQSLPQGIVGWDSSFRVVLGNEWVDDRQWLGALHRVRIYDRPLDALELQVNMHSRIEIQKLVLIDADTDLPIAEFDPLEDGAVLNFATLPTLSLNVEAVSPYADSMVFFYDGVEEQLENGVPYAFGGDSGGDFSAWTPTIGVHTIKAIPYRLPDAAGIPGPPITITFEAVNQ